MEDPRRNIPSVDVLLGSEPFGALLEAHPRRRVVQALRMVLADLRERAGASGSGTLPGEFLDYAREAEAILREWARPSLRPVINATGVVLHTNLGRAPLSEAARAAMARAAAGYSNLEFDLEAGRRGSRYVHCVELLREVTGAPDALVVNNNAAAVVLALNTLASGRGVLVSRGELVEIGGGFRIPEMLQRSGARLVEVGTTNRTRPEDYRRAAEEDDAAVILKVHRSNFRITGFTEEATLGELAALAKSLGLFLVHDLGSGLLADPEALGLPPEPTPPESLRAGSHLTAFSGDKLLGGPQAGILLGSSDLIRRLRENPLCRALRVDKVTLAGLEATLRHYLDPEEALREIPVLRFLSVPETELESRARALAASLSSAEVRAEPVRSKSVVGGGTYPGVEKPSWALRVQGRGQPPEELARHLRERSPAVVGRVEEGALLLDLRAVGPEEDEELRDAVLAACAGGDQPELGEEFEG